MAETTARDLCKKAMQKSGILFKNDTPDDDEINDVFDTLNDLLDSWSNDSLFIYARTWENFVMNSGQPLYTIGPGADFDTVRPIIIAAAYTVMPGATTTYPIKVISDEAYANQILVKSTIGIPEFVNYDNGYPTGKLRFWTVPSMQLNLYLLTEKQLTTFATLDQLIIFPPGWKRMIIANLAVEICAEYGQPTPAQLSDDARKSMGMIKRSIMKTRNMDSPIDSLRRRSILSDQY